MPFDNPKSIKPGQTAVLKATLHAGKVKGKVNKNVTIIPNAPNQPSVTVRVSAAVN